MGKAKKRNFHNCLNGKCTFQSTIKREDAVICIAERLKSGDLGNETKDLISLFGITDEELSEAGASYEELLALKTMFM